MKFAFGPVDIFYWSVTISTVIFFSHSGYSGPQCLSDIDECLSSPCQNSGSCLQPEADSYVCDCVLGYTGTHCEIDINECDADPCPDYQECTQYVNSYRFVRLE